MPNKITSASGTTTGANEDIIPTIKTATPFDGTDPNQVGYFRLKEVELFTDVVTDIKINDNLTYLANITGVTLSNGETYNYKIYIDGDKVNISSLEIAESGTKWAVTFVY